MHPKISVIIPVYNIENYVEKCVESVEQQTFCDAEIILVDDGSTDSSGNICDLLAEKNEKIKVIHKVNGGLSSARNAGLDVAIGEIIYFLDGDDYVEETLLQDIHDVMMNSDTDMVVFNYTKVKENGDVILKSNFLNQSYDLRTQEQKFSYIKEILLNYFQGWEAWNRAYKRQIICENNMRFVDNALIYAEDLLFLLMYLCHAKSIKFIDKDLYFYLIRDKSIMGEKGKHCNLKQIVELSHVHYKYLEEHNLDYLKAKYPVIWGILVRNECKSKKRKQIWESMKSIDPSPFLEEMICNAKKSKENPIRKLTSLFEISRYAQRITNNHLVIYIKKRVKHLLRGRYVYLIGTEDFGNLGDHQIAVSMIQYIKDYFPNNTVIEIPASCYKDMLSEEEKYIRARDYIFLPGGGNIGNKYSYSEDIRRYVIEKFPRNRIVIFPQTVSFDSTEEGELELAKSQQIYNNHNKLILATRDRQSYICAKEKFRCDVIKCPDIVLYTPYSKKRVDINRQGILLCLRNDEEGILKESDKVDIQNKINQVEESYEYVDNQFPFSITINQRKKYLDMMLNKFLRSSLVITDRLHGMIFAAITGTPCIAINNYNCKVQGAYQWITHLPYIHFCDNIEDIDIYIEKWKKEKGETYSYSNEVLLPYYRMLFDKIRK